MPTKIKNQELTLLIYATSISRIEQMITLSSFGAL